MTLQRSFRTAFVLMAFACAWAVVGCGDDVRLGKAFLDAAPPSFLPGDASFDAGAKDEPEPQPCDGRVCGDECEPGGIVIQGEWHCNPEGQCTTGLFSCDGG